MMIYLFSIFSVIFGVEPSNSSYEKYKDDGGKYKNLQNLNLKKQESSKHPSAFFNIKGAEYSEKGSKDILSRLYRDVKDKNSFIEKLKQLIPDFENYGWEVCPGSSGAKSKAIIKIGDSKEVGVGLIKINPTKCSENFQPGAILKLMNNDEEINNLDNLIDILSSAGNCSKFVSKTQNDLLGGDKCVAFPSYWKSYQDRGQSLCVSFIPAAIGESSQDFIKKTIVGFYKGEISKSDFFKKLCNFFEKLADSLSALNSCAGIINRDGDISGLEHNDLHPENIFWNNKDDKVSFIDNSQMNYGRVFEDAENIVRSFKKIFSGEANDGLGFDKDTMDAISNTQLLIKQCKPLEKFSKKYINNIINSVNNTLYNEEEGNNKDYIVQSISKLGDKLLKNTDGF